MRFIILFAMLCLANMSQAEERTILWGLVTVNVYTQPSQPCYQPVYVRPCQPVYQPCNERTITIYPFGKPCQKRCN